MDINIVIRKGVAYSFLIAILTVFYLVVVLTTEKFFQHLLGYQSFWVSLVYIVIIAITFTPLKDKIQHIVDRIIFKGTHEQIALENERLRQEIIQAEKSKVVSTLASGMAHEIKNPLTAIKTFSEHLPKNLENPEFLKKFSRIVGNEVDRIDNLVHQLLDFAKPSPLSLTNVDICALLNDTLSFLNSKLLQNKISIETSFTPQRIFIQADKTRLRQAFLNLLLNAIEAMPAGGTLNIRCLSLDSRDSQNMQGSSDQSRNTSHGNNYLTIIIADTGVGIAKKDLPHIFDPFYSNKDNGTGLGLSITQGIIQEHGGTITVDSAVGVGTTVTIIVARAS